MNRGWCGVFAVVLAVTACGSSKLQLGPEDAGAESSVDGAVLDAPVASDAIVPDVVDAMVSDGRSQVEPTSEAGPEASSNTPLSLPLASTGSAKLDVLFMIDNSGSMGDKQVLLADAVPDLINRLITPNCVDGQGVPVGGAADANGACALGSPEFPPSTTCTSASSVRRSEVAEARVRRASTGPVTSAIRVVTER